MTYRTRVAVAVALAVVVAVVLASVAAYVAAARTLQHNVDRALEQQVPDRELGPRFLDRLRERGLRPGIVQGFLGGAGAFVQLVRSDGTVLGAPGVDERLPVTDRTLAAARGGDRFFETVTIDGIDVRVFTRPVAPDVAIQVARPIEDVAESLRRLRRALLFVVLGGAGIAAVGGALVSRRAVRPVQRLTAAAETVADTHDLSHRIEVSGDDELARLAETFNLMLANLEDARRSQQQLVADASHELRTPLTSLRTNIEVLQREDELDPDDRSRLVRDVTAQLDEFGALVAGLVELARGDVPVRAPTEVRLDELVGDVVGRVASRYRDVTIDVESEPTVVRGEEDRLERAVTNLLDNACKYGDGGAIEVSVRDGAVVVRDHGPGLDPDDPSRIFDRFYRAPSARGAPGSGLGLAIVKQIAESHDGSVEAHNAPDGGAVFRLSLPPAQEASSVGRS
ncbi:MAG: HAMP domain-containing sensor histidine kinase [Nitriliruptorales bacterium]|nr:HAMP domain-containing sensor histidine kinase [Nitriliruptorales bacterium]